MIGDNSLASCPAVSVFSSQSVSALQLLSATLYSDDTLTKFLFGFGSRIISVFGCKNVKNTKKVKYVKRDNKTTYLLTNLLIYAPQHCLYLACRFFVFFFAVIYVIIYFDVVCLS